MKTTHFLGTGDVFSAFRHIVTWKSSPAGSLSGGAVAKMGWSLKLILLFCQRKNSEGTPDLSWSIQYFFCDLRWSIFFPRFFQILLSRSWVDLTFVKMSGWDLQAVLQPEDWQDMLRLVTWRFKTRRWIYFCGKMMGTRSLLLK